MGGQTWPILALDSVASYDNTDHLCAQVSRSHIHVAPSSYRGDVQPSISLLPIIVPKRNSEELCFVLDLSILNSSFIQTFKFQMPTVAQDRLHLHRGDWLAAINLKEAYWHVSINPQMWKFLAFRLADCTYQFSQLPFGLSLAPRAFIKISEWSTAHTNSL